MFNLIIREVGNINIALSHSPSKTISKKPREEKFYSIVGTNLGSRALAMLGIKIIAKVGNITYWAKFKDKLEDIREDKRYKKARLNNMT